MPTELRRRALALALPLVLLPVAASAQVVLYRQDFEHPTGFVNDGGDFNIFRTVNQLYGNQPPGFTFSQNFTVETLHIGGSEAFGVGYRDPQGRGGGYALGLLSNVQDDLLGLAFNVGAFDFLNFRLDVSSIDLDRQGGPFVPTGAVPTFRFTLYDNPSGAPAVAGSPELSFTDVTGTPGPNRYTFDWTNVVVGLSAVGNTNGNVILTINLLSGGYAAMDNFVVAASDVAGQVPPIAAVAPEPTTGVLLASGAVGVGLLARRRRVRRR
jgi:hypothetical protein